MSAALFAYVIYVNDIGVHHSCRCLRLSTEFGYEVGVLREFLLQHLDGNKSPQLVVFGLIYVRHTAGSYFIQDLVSISYHHP